MWTEALMGGSFGTMDVYISALSTILSTWNHKTITVYRLAYMLHGSTFVINPLGYEISQISCQARCNSDHLSVESIQIID